MTNTLTGDFDAVLEVSGGTLRRLIAGMHQNSFGDTSKPSIPHVAYFRLQGRYPLEGEHGSVFVQIGVPYVHLIHGATDRVQVEIGIRAQYHPDIGSALLADFIHGTVRAEYQFQDIDPNCWGWRDIAGDYLWLRVIEDSVTFDGTVYNASGIFELVKLLDEPTVEAHIRSHLQGLLAKDFAPTPQPLDRRYRRMRSLNYGEPFASAVAIPYGLSGEIPAGNVTSISELFLDGRDFGIAVSADSIMSKVRPMLDPLVGFRVDIFKTWDAGAGGGMTLDYHARVDAVTADWLGPFSLPLVVPYGGLIRIRATGVGWASRLYRSGIYNVGSVSASDLGLTFTADQHIALTFDAGAQRLMVAALGDPFVTVDYNGPFAGDVKPMARDNISSNINANIKGPLAQAQSQLDAFALPNARVSLSDQLQHVVDDGGAYFEDAVFRPDGVVVRGRIVVRHRYGPVVTFAKTPAGDGFDAIESWLPGGRVDRFDWSWHWFSTPVQKPPGPPGSTSDEDSFLLRRPETARNKFGMVLPRQNPLPGLDGWGEVCLTISGVQVDDAAGIFVPVTSQVTCAKWGSQFHMPYEVNGPYVRVCDPLRRRDGRPEEIGVLQVGVREAPEQASNTFVLYLHNEWNEDAVASLTTGLEQCRREGYGLVVVLLFMDGVLATADHHLENQIQELTRSLPATTLVAEDVHGVWTRTLALPTRGHVAWRLLSPKGLITWSHDGHAHGDLIASALEKRLEPGRPPSLVPLRPGVEVGVHLPFDVGIDPCPPAPVGRAGRAASKVVFVDKGAASTRTELERLGREYTAHGAEKPFIAVVLMGASAHDAEELRAQLQTDLPMLPDPRGDLTRRAGVCFSPTTITVDGWGRVAGVQMGVS
jgi:hypothetical protein